MFSGKLKKSIIITILCVFVLFNISFLIAPKKAQAQFVVSNPTLEANSFRDWIVDELIGLAQGVFFEGIMNAMNYFMQKLAYDAATWLAAGGNGQGTLFEYKNFGDYMADVGGNTLGELLGSLSDGWPIDLCDPSFGLPDITLSIQLGIADTEEPRPRCEWNELRSNWDEFVSTNNTRDVLREYGRSLRPGEGGLGSIVKLHEKAQEEEAAAIDAAARDREEGQGVKNVEQPVSGYTETPSLFVRESTVQKLVTSPEEAQQQQVSDSFSLTDSLLSMGLNVVSIFLNTLTSNLFNNMITGFVDVGDLVSDTSSLWDLGQTATAPSGGRIAAEEIFSDLLTPKLLAISDYNPTLELTMCPENRGSMNCTVDSSFSAALTQSSSGEIITVAEAVRRGYLHANWPLIPKDDKTRNQDPACHTYGYCYSNLVKLRKLRILPIGWEMAANSPANDVGNPVTLGEVIGDFDNCNEDGVGDAEHPWCHLIDPNWFIKYPGHQCTLQVYGPRLLNSQGDLREQVCADLPSCIEDNNEGECLGEWGYCTREKNIWRMTADSCPAEFSSCETLTSRDGKQVSYLRNTLDYNGCNAGNVGCVWYSQSKLADGSWDQNDRIYLNKNAEQCSENFAGCTDLIRKGSGISINYVKNPSFELNEDGFPDDWSLGLGSYRTSVYSTGEGDSYHGDSAVASERILVIGAPVTIYQQELSLPAGNFVISFYAKQYEAGGIARVNVNLANLYSGPLDVNEANTTCTYTGAGILNISDFMPGDVYVRTSCVFSLNSPEEIRLTLQNITPAGIDGPSGIWFDAIQIEEGLRPTAFRESGYPFNVEHAFLKAPPDYLNCTGNPERDNPECSNYARICRAVDVGCEFYSPVNGDPSISAIATNEDICPSECVGYDAFRQSETNFESENPMVFLISQNAEVCTFDAAGCDEFTNTETEEVIHATFLRQCSENFDLSATYYTWEGSDETGYQLKSWQLVSGSAVGATEIGRPPAYQSGFTDYSACSEEVFRNRTNPDCREFYDIEGHISYRLYSKTIIVSEECDEFRRTLQDEDFVKQEDDCRTTGGTWVDNACLYRGYLAESSLCGEKYYGCREYTGSTGRNFRDVFYDDFETGESTNWSSLGGLRVSTESLQAGGHSLRLSGTSFSRELSEDLDIHEGGIYTISFWVKGTPSNLSVSFRDPISERTISIAPFELFGGVVARITPSSGIEAGIQPIYFSDPETPSVDVATEWRRFELGPIYINRPISSRDILNIEVLNPVAGISPVIYLDNVQLREVMDNLYLIKDSWSIPRTCDMTIQGAPLPQAMVGCQEYTDKNGNSKYFKSFSRLCSEDVVGCESFIDTRNTSSPFEETWNEDTGSTLDTVTIGNDRSVYLVESDQFSCAQNNVGCSKVGYPKIERNDTPLSGVEYEERFIKINSNNFENTLCTDEELFCEEYRTTKGGLLYAKDPRERLCEYRDSGEISGWFKKGTNEACTEYFGTGDGVAFSFIDYEVQKNADEYYDGWVGLCDKKNSGCTTLVDVADSTKDYPDGKPYYVIRNEELDTESCSGQVSRLEGCVLFDDLNDPSAKYRSDSTYNKSNDLKSGGKVTAVSCPGGGDDCKRCVWQQTRESAEVDPDTGLPLRIIVASGYGDGCRESEDCIDMEIPEDELFPLGEVSTSCIIPRNDESKLVNNTNLIVKVTPDRVCGEWLSCRSTVTVYDEVAGREKEICSSLDLCSQFEQTGEQEARCTKFVEGENANKILTEAIYQNRDISWSGMEYSGYSIPEQYQIADLEAITIEGDKRLVHVLGSCDDFAIECGRAPEGGLCSSLIGEVRGGRIYNGLCITGIDGENYGYLFTPSARQSLTERSCRAYPEQSSPFPPIVANWNGYLDDYTKGALSDKKQGFLGAQVCERYAWLDADADNFVDINEGELVAQDCECSYKKASYGRGTVNKYYSYGQEFLPEGICFGGLRDGMQCTPGVSETCGPAEEGGSCESLTRADSVLGLGGYCLEYDYSVNINGSKEQNPCLTWRPIEIPEGGQDVYNQYSSAGYDPPGVGVGKYFCLMGEGNTDLGDYSQSRVSGSGLSDITISIRSGGGERYTEVFYHRQDGWPEYKEDLAGIALRLNDAWTGSLVDQFYKDQENVLKRTGKHTGEFRLLTNGKTYSYWEVRAPGTDEGIDPWITGEDTMGTGAPLFVLPWTDAWRDMLSDGEYVTFDYQHPTVPYTTPNVLNIGYVETCELREVIKGEYGEHYFGVRAVFDDATDKFLGFWISSCSGDIDFDVEFLLAEYCKVLAQVDYPYGMAKAKTNEVWEYSGTKLVDTYYGEYTYETWNRPFGSAASRSMAASVSTEPWFIGAEGSNGSPYFTTDYFTPGAIDSGTPLGCDSTDGTGCYWEGTSAILFESLSEAIDHLKNLFASVYEIFVWRQDGNNSYTPIDTRGIVSGWNDTDIVYVASPVRIAGVSTELNSRGNPKPVFEETAGGTVLTQTISVNDVSGGIIDVGNNLFKAVVRFYAWADRDQMPLISRWINWRDGSPSEQVFGKYKNHKPICASSPTEALGYCTGPVVVRELPCSDDSDCPGISTCSINDTKYRCSNDLSRACSPGTTDPSSDRSCQRDYGTCEGNLSTGYSCSLNPSVICDPTYTIFGIDEDEEVFDPYDPYGESTTEERKSCRIDYGECIDMGGESEISFGNSPEACEENYFEFTHYYECNEEILDSLDACSFSGLEGRTLWDGSEETASLVYNIPCKFENKCVFKPEVRVVDNWGWCNATTKDRCDEEIIEGGASNFTTFRGLIILNP